MDDGCNAGTILGADMLEALADTFVGGEVDFNKVDSSGFRFWRSYIKSDNLEPILRETFAHSCADAATTACDDDKTHWNPLRIL